MIRWFIFSGATTLTLYYCVGSNNITNGVVTGPDPQPYIDKVQEYLDVGFDHVYFQQTGPNQKEAIEFFQEEVVPEFS